MGLCLAVHAVPAAESFNLTEIAPGVHVHHGLNVSTDDPRRGDIANIGFVLGQRCVAVIDTGGSYATGLALKAAVARVTTLPVCFVINTHAHFDHVLGNPAFRDGQATFVGNSALPDVVAGSEEFYARRFAAERAGAKSTVLPAEGLWVSSSQTLDLGGRSLTVDAVPTAHSSADLAVYDPQTGTLWTGDLVFLDRLPVLDGSLAGWLRWLDGNEARPYARVVPGHGPVSAPWPAAAAPERAYLEALGNDAKAAIKAGLFLEDVLAHAGENPPLHWLLTAPHARNTGKAYREFEWNQAPSELEADPLTRADELH